MKTTSLRSSVFLKKIFQETHHFEKDDLMFLFLFLTSDKMNLKIRQPSFLAHGKYVSII